MHRGSIHQRHPKAPFKSKPCGFDCYTVLAPVSKCYPLLMGRLPTCYSPVRHSFSFGGASSGERKSVRLACIRHAASVRPEPGSNSHLILFSFCHWQIYRFFWQVTSVTRTFGSYCSVFKGLCLTRDNFYILSNLKRVVNIFFKKVSKLFSNLFLSPSRTTAILAYHFFNALSRSFLIFSPRVVKWGATESSKMKLAT